MNIKIPELSLVTLVGVSGSGKSTFAARHFLPTEVLSSDFCRGLVLSVALHGDVELAQRYRVWARRLACDGGRRQPGDP